MAKCVGANQATSAPCRCRGYDAWRSLVAQVLTCVDQVPLVYQAPHVARCGALSTSASTCRHLRPRPPTADCIRILDRASGIAHTIEEHEELGVALASNTDDPRPPDRPLSPSSSGLLARPRRSSRPSVGDEQQESAAASPHRIRPSTFVERADSCAIAGPTPTRPRSTRCQGIVIVSRPAGAGVVLKGSILRPPQHCLGERWSFLGRARHVEQRRARLARRSGDHRAVRWLFLFAMAAGARYIAVGWLAFLGSRERLPSFAVASALRASRGAVALIVYLSAWRPRGAPGLVPAGDHQVSACPAATNRLLLIVTVRL